MNKGLKEKILKLYKEGRSYNEIKEMLNCSKGTISYHCRKSNLVTRYRVFNSEERQEILRLYIDERWTNKQLAAQFLTSSYMIKTITTNVKRDKIGSSASVVNWRKRVKLRLIAYFGGKCELCGYDRCEGALEFHHKNPKEKDFTIGGKSWGFEKLLKEAKKCILVCGNCHSEIHAGIR